MKRRPFARFIMLVSTIEPRKGHRMVQAVWDTLLKEGIPQRLDAGLVLVGRPGWMVDDLMVTLQSTERIAILDEIDDAGLAALYDAADFCIYPSEYEGYGLPVVEALCRQKPVIASNVGVVPELESSLLKRLAADDEDAWYAAIRHWLLTPPDPQLSNRFRHPNWQEAAATIFASLMAESQAKHEPFPSGNGKIVRDDLEDLEPTRG
jgi:glycosyltransferase involved in cell wall biosynthesis